MSFFGLTSFGPESVLRSNFKNNDDEEFKRGFEKCVQKTTQGDKLKLEFTRQFLQFSISIPPLDSEVEDFIRTSRKRLEDYLTWEEVLQVINTIRENHRIKAEKSVNYRSFQKYYDDTYKHKRKEAEPSEVFKAPVTYNQNVGFYKFEEGRDLNDVHRPIRKCNETKFAEEMIKTGKQFL